MQIEVYFIAREPEEDTTKSEKQLPMVMPKDTERYHREDLVD
jgi:hypothetical protein